MQKLNISDLVLSTLQITTARYIFHESKKIQYKFQQQQESNATKSSI